MTCMDTLHTLLSADLTKTGSDGELAAHLMTCSRCQAIAEQLRVETAALASVARAVPLSAPRRVEVVTWRTPRVAALALAALLIVVLLPDSATQRARDEAPDAPDAPNAPAIARTQSVAGSENSSPVNETSGSTQRVAAEIQSTRPNPQSATRAASQSLGAERIGRSTPSTSPVDSRRLLDLGAPIPAPSPVEAIRLLPVQVALAEPPGDLEGASSEPGRKAVLLPQSNPRITVFWVF